VGSLTALLLAVSQGVLSLGQSLAAWVHGMKSMMTAMVILILAWGIGAVCSDLNTANFLVTQLSDSLNPSMLPALIFILAAATAFATGTSWATMSILIPLAIPTALGISESAGLDPESAHRILLAAVSAVLAGALFGDHCSPISDTTVMSSMSSGCDHVDHVRTQLPYALTVAVVALVFGYIPAGFGVSPWISMVLGSAVLYGILRVAGRRARG
jgi:Na+/H+ antiporter NhaC